MIIAGLTGNYGMGKSSVLSMFQDLGAVTLDSDKIVADLLLKRTVISKIRNLLGSEVMNLDGSLNKKNIANIIFNNMKLKSQLEALLHPLVMKEIGSYINKIRDKNSIVIVEVPLLFEGGYDRQFQRTIVVYASQKTLFERLKKKGVSRKEALLRLNSQIDIRKKKRMADFVVDNGGSLSETRRQAENIYELFLEGGKILSITSKKARYQLK